MVGVCSSQTPDSSQLSPSPVLSSVKTDVLSLCVTAYVLGATLSEGPLFQPGLCLASADLRDHFSAIPGKLGTGARNIHNTESVWSSGNSFSKISKSRFCSSSETKLKYRTDASFLQGGQLTVHVVRPLPSSEPGPHITPEVGCPEPILTVNHILRASLGRASLTTAQEERMRRLV